MVPDGWQVEYFEKEDGRQPAEEFEDWLDRGDRDHRKIGGSSLGWPMKWPRRDT